MFCVATNNAVIDIFCFATKSQRISCWPLLCCLLLQFWNTFWNTFHFYIFDPFQNTIYEKPKLWIIHKLKHFVDTIFTSSTAQVFFLHNYFVKSIIFYFLCHIFYKTWVFFYYSKFDYLWSSLHCFLRGWQLFLYNNWLPDWLVWNTFLQFAEIANILALCIARFCCVLCCNKQWSYWHVLPLPQNVNMNICCWLLLFCVVSSYSLGGNQGVVLH